MMLFVTIKFLTALILFLCLLFSMKFLAVFLYAKDSREYIKAERSDQGNNLMYKYLDIFLADILTLRSLYLYVLANQIVLLVVGVTPITITISLMIAALTAYMLFQSFSRGPEMYEKGSAIIKEAEQEAETIRTEIEELKKS